MYDEYNNNRILQTGNYLGLKFSDGWVFLHVLESERIDLKPWILYNQNNEREAIPPRTAGSEDDEIKDEVNRHLVTPRDRERDQIFQLQVGIAEDRIQLYPQFGRDSNPNLVGGAEPGDPQVPVDGFDSPYNDPSERGEFFSLNDIDDFALQAYNPTDEPLEARISFHVNKFRYAVLEDRGMMRGFLQGQIPWKDHIMGLGASQNDQIRAPGWFTERFGDNIYTTEEILNYSGNGGSGMNTNRLPDVTGGGQ